MNPYPTEVLDQNDDDGTMPQNVDQLRQAVVGHRIKNVEKRIISHEWRGDREEFVITLDNAKQVRMANTDDCCAYTDLKAFLLHPDKVDHVIMGVGTTGEYTTWHIYADLGDILELTVDWSCGNPFYYGYGFDITVENEIIDVESEEIIHNGAAIGRGDQKALGTGETGAQVSGEAPSLFDES